MAKIGLHVAYGPRDNYGPFCSSIPAVVVAADEGGALLEAKQKSNGRTTTVFRDTSIYLEAPPEWNQTSDMIGLARFYWPALRTKWQQNPADYYQMTNEIGGGEGADVEGNLKKLIAYEGELMRLANLDGFKVTVLNHAGGSPGDVSLWQRLCVPFIFHAWQGGNAYARHAYGGGDLLNSSGAVIIGNPSRPLEESAYLYSIGGRGRIIISELGIDGGKGFAGIDRFAKQIEGYERIIRNDPLISCAAAWTVGIWQDANCQAALPRLSQYNLNNPTDPWVPPTTQPPSGYKSVVFKIAQEHTADEWSGIARIAHQEFKRTMTASADNCVVMVLDGNAESYAVVFDPELPSQVATIQQLTAMGLNYQTRAYRVPPQPPTNPQIVVTPISQRDPRWASVSME